MRDNDYNDPHLGAWRAPSVTKAYPGNHFKEDIGGERRLEALRSDFQARAGDSARPQNPFP